MKVITSGTLEDIIQNITEFEDEMVLYADQNVKWGPRSKSCVYDFEKDEQVPAIIDEIPYFLEVSLVKEVIDVWRRWTPKEQYVLKEFTEAVIFYAENDSYKPVSNS